MLLLTIILSFVPVIPALQMSSCIKYETYITTQYRMIPLELSDSWFSHSLHFSPRKITKVSLRSRRLFGCCEPGYTYARFPSYGCRPLCSDGCQMNAHCTAPNQCACDYGYYKDAGSGLCLSKETLTSKKILEKSTATEAILIETVSPKIPCNGSCRSNEVCSQPSDICVCANGFERSTDTLNCVPRCDNRCQNADCTAPNTCTCWPHYQRTNDSSTCHLKCTELSCTFGECNENGICICAEGFFNNGTNCIWAGDDIFSEPDFCKCWSKFIWQKNLTESRCLNSCEEDELSSDCIPFKECEFYEGYTICHSQMYKCNDMLSFFSTTTIPNMTDKINGDIVNTNKLSSVQGEIVNSKNSAEVILLIVAFISLFIVLIASLWIWTSRRSWFRQLWNYNRMDSIHEDEQV